MCIKKMTRTKEGMIELVVQGAERVVLVDIEQTTPYLTAQVRIWPLPVDSGPEVEALHMAILEMTAKALELAQPQASSQLSKVLVDEDPLHLVSSTCLEIIAVTFAEELAQRPPCEHQVANVASVVTLVDCNDRAVLGSLDTLGVITYALPEESGTIEECSIALTADVRVPAGLTPTTATYVFELRFAGSCPLPTCTVTAAGPWTLLP